MYVFEMSQIKDCVFEMRQKGLRVWNGSKNISARQTCAEQTQYDRDGDAALCFTKHASVPFLKISLKNLDCPTHMRLTERHKDERNNIITQQVACISTSSLNFVYIEMNIQGISHYQD